MNPVDNCFYSRLVRAGDHPNLLGPILGIFQFFVVGVNTNNGVVITLAYVWRRVKAWEV
jgi:hypothetical protein